MSNVEVSRDDEVLELRSSAGLLVTSGGIAIALLVGFLVFFSPLTNIPDVPVAFSSIVTVLVLWVGAAFIGFLFTASTVSVQVEDGAITCTRLFRHAKVGHLRELESVESNCRYVWPFNVGITCAGRRIMISDSGSAPVKNWAKAVAEAAREIGADVYVDIAADISEGRFQFLDTRQNGCDRSA